MILEKSVIESIDFDPKNYMKYECLKCGKYWNKKYSKVNDHLKKQHQINVDLGFNNFLKQNNWKDYLDKSIYFSPEIK